MTDRKPIGIPDLLRWFDRYGWTEGEGEWGEIQRNERNELRDALTGRDPAVIGELFDNWFRSSLYWGLVSIPGNTEASVKELFPLAIYWRMALWRYTVEPFVLDRLRAPVWCNPLCYHFDDVPVMLDAPRFDRYADVIVRTIGSRGTLYEIGGGYGGTVLQVQRRAPGMRVVMCDIPETLYLAAWWLSRALPPKVTVGWWDEAPDATVVLLPLQERVALQCEPDMVFAAHTFSGLPDGEYEGWREHIAQLDPTYIYHDDVLHRPLSSGIWLTDRYEERLLNAMVFDGYRELWRTRIPWSGWTDRFAERMLIAT